MHNKLEERDFVGFLSKMYIKRKIFYIFFILMMSTATGFNSYYNKEYKSTIELKTPYNDFYSEIKNYFIFLNRIEVIIFDTSVTSAYDNSINLPKDMSEKSSFNIISDLMFDQENIRVLAKQFTESPYYNGTYTYEKIIFMIRGAISIKTLPAVRSALFTITSNNEGLVEFLSGALPSFLNGVVGDKYKEYTKVFEESKVSEINYILNGRKTHIKKQLYFISKKLDLIRGSVSPDKEEQLSISSVEINMLLEEQLQLTSEMIKLKSYVVPIKEDFIGTVNFFYLKVEGPQEQAKINGFFVFTFFGFISLILFLVVIICLDLQEQVRARLKSPM